MSENAVETPAKSINAFTAFEHYDDFNGKASLSEFWSFYFLVHVVILVLMIPGLPVFFQDNANDITAINNWHAPLALALPIIIWGLIVLIPLCAVLVRRVRSTTKNFRTLFFVIAVVLTALSTYGFILGKVGLAVTLFWWVEHLLILSGLFPDEKEKAPEA